MNPVVVDAIRSEWIKLRSARANIVVILCAMGSPLVISVLSAVFGDYEFTSPSDIFTSIVLGPTYICAFMAGVLGVLGIGQEYRHSTIRVTFAAQPRRSVVLTAKCIVNGLFGLYIGLVTPVVCFGVSGLILKARNIDVSLVDPRVNLIALVGQGLFAGLMTLMGFGIGCLLRQPSGAIPLLLLWPLVGEGILSGLLELISHNSWKWLPFRAGFRLGIAQDVEGELLSRPVAGVYFLAWTVAVVAFGWWAAERRDA